MRGGPVSPREVQTSHQVWAISSLVPYASGDIASGDPWFGYQWGAGDRQRRRRSSKFFRRLRATLGECTTLICSPRACCLDRLSATGCLSYLGPGCQMHRQSSQQSVTVSTQGRWGFQPRMERRPRGLPRLAVMSWRQLKYDYFFHRFCSSREQRPGRADCRQQDWFIANLPFSR